MKRFLYYAILSSTLLMSLFESSPRMDGFDDQDSNQDGVLSGREVGTLKAIDADGDGEISRAEFQAAVKSQRARASEMVATLFRERDKNEDKRLSGSEVAGIEHCDADRNGRITEQELLQGFSHGDPALEGKTFSQIAAIAEQRFEKVDINRDSRLTGMETSGSSHFDLNADSRITKEEFIVGMILSSSASNSPAKEIDREDHSDANPKVDMLVNEVVSAINDFDKAKTIHDRMHEKLKEITDICILDYAFQHALGAHGEFKQPAKNQIKQTKLENGAIQIEANLPCPQGKMTLNMQVLRGQITALGLISPEMNTLDRELNKDLQNKRMQDRFASTYGREVENVIKAIVKGDDETAVQRIHPSVIKLVGREPFDKVCQKLRSRIESIDSMTIETFATNKGENDIYTFTITYLVKCKSKGSLFGCTFQREGLHVVMTGMSVENLSDTKSLLRKEEKISPPPATKPTPKIANSDLKWIETVSIRDGVKFKLPGESSRIEKEDGKEARWNVDIPNMSVSFQMEVDTYDFEFHPASRVYFDTYRDALLKNPARKLVDEKIDPRSGYPAQLIVIKHEDGRFTATLSIGAGNKLYSATCDLPSESNEYQVLAKKFFDSIVLIDAGGAHRVGPLQADKDGEVPAPPAPVAPPAPITQPAPIAPPGL